MSPGIGLLFKVCLLAAFPIALFATRFFRHGELRAMRALALRLRPSVL
jgi:hypothetical protein